MVVAQNDFIICGPVFQKTRQFSHQDGGKKKKLNRNASYLSCNI